MDTGDNVVTTLDAFHRGGFWLVQPANRGHRAGMDAMVLAAAIPPGSSGRLADLGAGAGAAGFSAVARNAGLSATLVERDGLMAACARESLGLPQNRHLAGRIEVIEANVTLAGKARVDAGLADRAFDFAIMNPPFNESGDRQTPDEIKRGAHVMEEGQFEAWIRTAAAIVKPKGGMALIARLSSLAVVLAAVDGRFGALQLKPVHPRADKPAIRFVLRGTRSSRKALSLLPPLILHGRDEYGFTPEADAICNGTAPLFDD